jgi:hypothetical protein
MQEVAFNRRKTGGQSEIAYANTTLITALFHILADKGLLTEADLEKVATNAIKSFSPTGTMFLSMALSPSSKAPLSLRYENTARHNRER